MKNLFRSLLLTAALAGCAADVLVTPAGEIAKNQNIVRQHYAQLNRGDVATAVQNYAEDSKNHGRPVGRDGLRQVLDDIHTTFPDWRMEIVEIVAAGDSVVVKCRVSGTHQGVGKLPINGAMLVGVAPTGKHFEVQHIHWYQLRAGKIVDHWANRDDIGMMRQLGLLPPGPAMALPAAPSPR